MSQVPTADYYVAGPMGGYRGMNHQAFEHAVTALRLRGLKIVSPHEVKAVEPAEWAEYMRLDIPLLLSARAVAVLPGWEASRGAQLEVHIAHALGMHVLPLAVILGVQP